MSWNESAWLTAMTGAALKSTGVLCVAWMLTFLLRRKSAAARHLVWTAAAAAILALPVLSLSLPDLPVPVTAFTGTSIVFQTTASSALDQAAEPAHPGHPNW